MRTVRLLVVVLAAFFSLGGTAAAQGNCRNFVAHLNAASEVPPHDTLAEGQAIFHLSADGTELHYKLIVANIENVMQAHIHIAPQGVNGPVVAFLFHGPMISGRSDGVLAEGTITQADLIGPLKGQSLADLLTALCAGNAYVNVHTSQFPAGEIRGQIH